RLRPARRHRARGVGPAQGSVAFRAGGGSHRADRGAQSTAERGGGPLVRSRAAAGARPAAGGAVPRSAIPAQGHARGRRWDLHDQRLPVLPGVRPAGRQRAGAAAQVRGAIDRRKDQHLRDGHPARTGLHSLIVAALFAAAAFAAPLAGIVPAAATAPALIAVGFLMCKQLTRVDFAAVDTALPAFVVAVGIPFTYSISHGIGYGFITYTVVQIFSGRVRFGHLRDELVELVLERRPGRLARGEVRGDRKEHLDALVLAQARVEWKSQGTLAQRRVLGRGERRQDAAPHCHVALLREAGQESVEFLRAALADRRAEGDGGEAGIDRPWMDAAVLEACRRASRRRR